MGGVCVVDGGDCGCGGGWFLFFFFGDVGVVGVMTDVVVVEVGVALLVVWGGFLCICYSWWWRVSVVVVMGD